MARPESKSKSSRKSSPKQPAHFEFNPVWIKAGVWAAGVGFVVLSVCYFESINRHVQMDRRLARDPEMAQWYTSAKQRIEAAGGESGAGRPVAVWYGKIANCRSSNPKSGSPALLAVELANARLMAGAKGSQDDASKLYISTRNSDVAKLSPRVGDEWVFSVWRDDKGNNHTQSACPYRRSGS